ncbi:MAG: redoxin domain-containing protein [Planctomycetota bacterium]
MIHYSRGFCFLSAVIVIVSLSGCGRESVDDRPWPQEAQGAISSAETALAPGSSGKPDSAGNLTASSSAPMPMSSMPMPSPADVRFKDSVESNTEVPAGLDGLVFLDTAGKRVALEKFLGKKNVVLVFTEGFAGGMLCPFCKTQTSRLVANHDRFADLDTQILVVYPGARDHLDEFIEAAKKTEKVEVDSVPFPLLLDENLRAVGYFNIESNLAHPSTFIIDKSGNVRLAYVGADMTADRPSVNAMLKVVEAANAESTDEDE